MTTLLHEDLRELALEFAQDALTDIEYIRIVEALEDITPKDGVASEEDIDFVIDEINTLSAGLRKTASWDHESIATQSGERRELLDEMSHLTSEHHTEAEGFYRLAGMQMADGDSGAAWMNASQAQLHEHTAAALRLAYEQLAD